MNYQSVNNYVGVTGEKYKPGSSVTIPSMTLPLAELVRRYVRGDSVEIFEPVWNGEDEYPEVEKMDTMARVELATTLKKRVREYRETIPENVEDVQTETAPAKTESDQVV